MHTENVSIPTSNGHLLDARIDWPSGQKPRAFAVFAHCFTCNKNLKAIRKISNAITQEGIALLSFDFTGLGESAGEFAETNFTSNLDDLQTACSWLALHHQSPQLIVGHSLGGAAALYAAAQVDSVKAVATIAAPADPEHVTHLLQDDIHKIEQEGEATVVLAGRPFKIKKQFLEDLNERQPIQLAKELRGKALLVIHSPQDKIVGIQNARSIFESAHHPKSFISLDGADHLLTSNADASYVGSVIGQWAARYLDQVETLPLKTDKRVVVRLSGERYTTKILAGGHHLLADEPEHVGGNDLGPTPYDFVATGLASCTAMTLKMYALRKKLPLTEITVHVDHVKDYATDCENCESTTAKIDQFKRFIQLKGDLTENQEKKLLAIADKCPVHKTLVNKAEVHTVILPN